jgi:RND family efflux transporter MFP subunit
MCFNSRIVIIRILMVLSLLCCACGNENEAAPTASEPVRPVLVQVVEEATAQRPRAFSGAIKGEVETMLSFRVAGEIIDLPVQVGQFVNSGERIAALDPTDYRLQVKEAQAALAQAEAMLARAQADFERATMLYETQNISRAELDNALAGFRSARAQVQAAEERLGLARQQLKYTTLRSPREGTVADVPVEVHQSVAPGSPVVVLTSRTAPLFEIGVPDRLIRDVATGAQAEVRLDALPDVAFLAHVIEVGVLSREFSVFPVTLQLEQMDPRIFSGMIGEAVLTFALTERESLPTVPPEAVWSDQGRGRFVWILNPRTMTVHARRVETGALIRGGLVVRKGLEPGEQIVIRGVHRLRDGQQVSLMEEKSR